MKRKKKKIFVESREFLFPDPRSSAVEDLD